MVVGHCDTHGVLLAPLQLPKECTYWRTGERGGSVVYLGANRCPASSRRHWPLSIGLSTIAATSLAYSIGRPIRLGKAASRVNVAAISSGTIWVNPVRNRLGAIASTRIPSDPRSRAMVRHIPAMPALAAV